MSTPLGIIAGATDLPRVIAESNRAAGRDVFIIALEDYCDEKTVDGFPREWVRIGAVGKAISTLRKHDVEEVVLAGKVSRPKLTQVRPDLKATKLLARLGSNLMRGDDELLRQIVTFLEEEGLRIVGIDQAAPELITPEGLIGNVMPDKRTQEDISFGARIARSVGALDIGQSVAVQHQQVLAVEAIEGTASMIARAGCLKVDKQGGVVVKVKKPHQEIRVDMPTMGVDTIDQIANAGLAGIAIEAGSSLMLNRREIIRRADEAGIFVLGFTVETDEVA
jgi:DUF1009 family protein